MKIAFAPYVLQSFAPLNALTSGLRREGALLRFTFEPGFHGYADCHPWPELGDLPLLSQLAELRAGRFTDLTGRSRYFAVIDGEARLNKVHLLNGQKSPESHFLLTDLIGSTSSEIDEIIKKRYTRIKIKMGRNFESECRALVLLFKCRNILLRLDFNESCSLKEFSNYLKKLEPIRQLIEWIEDPFPFHESEWKAIQKDGWTLACDRNALKGSGKGSVAKFLIIKPAIFDVSDQSLLEGQERVVTSYLGHPFEQCCAAYIASQSDKDGRLVHGLHSHSAYRINLFSRHMNRNGPVFTPAPGTGFGFDDELQAIDWKDL